jgi:hypothetical protein
MVHKTLKQTRTTSHYFCDNNESVEDETQNGKQHPWQTVTKNEN